MREINYIIHASHKGVYMGTKLHSTDGQFRVGDTSSADELGMRATIKRIDGCIIYVDVDEKKKEYA